MRTARIAVLVVSGAVACGGSGAREHDTTTPPPAPAPKVAVAVELAEITVYESGQPMVRLHADGTSEITSQLRDTPEAPSGVWDPGPTLAADGTVSFNGKDVARINADGTIVDLLTQTNLPVTVTADRVTVSKDGSVRGFALGPTGEVGSIDGDKTTALPIRVEGAGSPDQRRTVLSYLVLIFGRAQAHPPGS